MAIDTKQITGLILAGGRGTRMGGVDKGLRPFRGAPMVSHVIARLAPQVGALMINANQNRDTYEGFGLPVREDELGGFEGPLAGVQAGLNHCTTDYLVTAPCDSPFLPEDLVARLAEALSANNADVAVAVTGDGQTLQRHPVFCLMKRSLLPHLSDYLANGGRKIETWYRSLPYVEVRFADESAFRNINTLEELNRFEPQ